MPINNEAIDIEEDEIPEGLDELLDETLTAMEIQDKFEEKEKAKKFVSKSFAAPSLKAKPKVKRAKIKSSKLLDKGPKDLQGVGSDEKLVGGINDNLTRVSESLGAIEEVLRQQFGIEKSESEKDSRSAALEKAKEREEKLEGKKKVQKDRKGALKAIKPPAIGFFDTLKNYFKNILVGSALVGFLNWLKDPQNQKKIDDFKSFISNNIPLILGGLALIIGVSTGIIPLIFTLVGTLLTGLPILAKMLGFLATPLGIKALLVALGAGLIFQAAEFLKDKTAGGKGFRAAYEQNNAELNAAGVGQPSNPFAKEAPLLTSDGKGGFFQMQMTGVDQRTGQLQNLTTGSINPDTGKPYASNLQIEAFNNWKVRKANIDKAAAAMGDEIKTKRSEIESERKSGLEELSGNARKAYATETRTMQDQAEAMIRYKANQRYLPKEESQEPKPSLMGSYQKLKEQTSEFTGNLEQSLGDINNTFSESFKMQPPEKKSPEVSFLPVGAASETPTSAAAANQTPVPVFSAFDSNMPYSMAVRSIYNMVNA